MKISTGQFWQDLQTKDIYRIDKVTVESISQKVQKEGVWVEEHEAVLKGKTIKVDRYFLEGGWTDGPSTLVEYATPSVYVRGSFFGVGAPMKTEHFQTLRFKKLSTLAAYWALGLARVRARWQ